MISLKFSLCLKHHQAKAFQGFQVWERLFVEIKNTKESFLRWSQLQASFFQLRFIRLGGQLTNLFIMLRVTYYQNKNCHDGEEGGGGVGVVRKKNQSQIVNQIQIT